MSNLPPSTPIPNLVLYHPDLSDEEKITYGKLLALSWRYSGERTDPLDYENEVIPLIGSHGRARRHMNSLHAAGLLNWTTNGDHQYIFTFPSPNSGTSSPKSGTPDTNSGASSEPSSPNSGTPGTKSGTWDGENVSTSPKNGTRNPIFGTPNAPSEAPVPEGNSEDSLINLNNLNTYPKLPLDARLEKILAATGILFGDESLWRPTKPVTFFILLAHLAQAYQEHTHGRLRFPAGSVFDRIKRGLIPQPAYLADPLAHLPAKFLAAAGLEAFIPASDEPAAAEDSGGDELAPDEQLIETDPSATEPIRPDGPTPAYAWEYARGELQREMSKAAFDTYISPTWVARYQDGVFWIRAADPPACDWLQSRMTSTIVRLLAGICNCTVKVVFVACLDGKEVVSEVT